MRRNRIAPRSHVRYLVESDFPVTATIPQTMTYRHQIRTLSLQGCGFYVTMRDTAIIRAPLLEMTLKIGKGQLLMKGKIQYCTLVPNFKTPTYYVGVQFDAYDPKIEEILKIVMERGLEAGHLKPQIIPGSQLAG